MFDEKLFEKIFSKYSEQLYKYCYLKLSNKELSEEVVNDVFKILYIKWNTIDTETDVRPYLYRIADNCIKTAMRREKKYYDNNQSIDQAYEEGGLNRAVSYDEYFYISIEEYYERIQSHLTDEYRQLFVYRFIEKMTIERISETTGIPYSSVRLRLRKLKKRIRMEIRKINN
ncbi:MAG: sigma-70 family RNA polymerase sigma factor [Clostridia bacterium]|nr:sigma-70 family RNA polymerase sigma factor [Clostridia bacterium]